jgi:hypothetical protein
MKNIGTPQAIGNHLIEAYVGRFEDDWEVKQNYEAYVKQEGQDGQVAVEAFARWIRTWAKNRILSDTPKERLTTYLEWNGIFGYANIAFEIATGELK